MAVTRTFLVECYLPDVDADDVDAASARARSAAATLRAVGHDVAYRGAMYVAADEVVFHVFAAIDRSAVEAASRAARLEFERITESIPVPGEEAADPVLPPRPIPAPEEVS